MRLNSGKLDPGVLRKRVLSYLGSVRPEVVAHARVGEDAAAIAFDGEVCVLSSDPITGAGEDAGWYAVHVGMNDVAAAGAEPVGVLLTLLLPVSATEDDVEAVMSQADRAARELGIEIIGGHTEVTGAVGQPVICVTAVGRTRRDSLIHSGGARPGHALLMTKTAGLEGTAILAADFRQRLAGCVGDEVCERAIALKAGLSVVREALAAARAGATAMHDATEGGVLGAIHELVTASGTGVEVDVAVIPVATETTRICAALGADPLRLVSSGALLITCEDGPAMVTAVRAVGVQAAVIGRIVAVEDGRTLLTVRGHQTLEPPDGDELWRMRACLGGGD